MMLKYYLFILSLFSAVLFVGHSLFAQQARYPDFTESTLILQGDPCSWDSNSVHTFSVVKANKDGYKYWAYYALDYYGGDKHRRRGGLARSNDLVHWIKYEYNPIINSDCRWSNVILHDGVFYMCYAEYNEDNDSRIVMVTSTNGIDFSDKIVIVPLEKGKQNQNPFIYYNENDSQFYLFYYHGVERASDKKDNVWNIYFKKGKKVTDLKDAIPQTLMTSPKILAAPSVAYYNNRYYLLVEEFNDEQNKWVTTAFESDKIDGGYIKLSNNPILADNDACAFQYVLDNQLYIFYSHCLDLVRSDWEIRMVKVK